MQVRGIGLRSVGPSSQKLWPKQMFAFLFPCILYWEPKKIRTPFSRQVRDLTQMAKLAKIAPKTRIQGATYMGFNFNQNVSRYSRTCVLVSNVCNSIAPNNEQGQGCNVLLQRAAIWPLKSGLAYSQIQQIVQQQMQEEVAGPYINIARVTLISSGFSFLREHRGRSRKSRCHQSRILVSFLKY